MTSRSWKGGLKTGGKKQINKRAHLKQFQGASGGEMLWLTCSLRCLSPLIRRRWGSHQLHNAATSHSTSRYARAAYREIVRFLQFNEISSNWVTPNGQTALHLNQRTNSFGCASCTPFNSCMQKPTQRMMEMMPLVWTWNNNRYHALTVYLLICIACWTWEDRKKKTKPLALGCSLFIWRHPQVVIIRRPYTDKLYCYCNSRMGFNTRVSSKNVSANITVLKFYLHCQGGIN